VNKIPFSAPDLFVPGVESPSPNGEELWFALKGNDLLIRQSDSSVRIPHGGDFDGTPDRVLCRHFLGTLGDQRCHVAEFADSEVMPEGIVPVPLREMFGVLPEDHFALAGRATQIITWDRTHRFCGRCGTRTRDKQGERAKECPACGLLSFPRVSPAIIVAVVRDDTLLLARSSRYRNFKRFSVVAGFVEAGETLEDAVRREVMEETSVSVRNIRYFGSQPWPFPHSLMLGFTAEYASGDVHPSDGELIEADWFAADSLPEIPDHLSISRRLIDWFVETQHVGT